MSHDEFGVFLTMSELHAAHRRAAFFIPIMRRLSDSSVSPNRVNLQKVAHLVQEMGHVPLKLQFVLHVGLVHSFALEEELDVLVGTVYSLVPKSNGALYVPGQPNFVRQVESLHGQEFLGYATKTGWIIDQLMMFSPEVMDLLSLGWYLKNTQKSPDWVDQMREHRTRYDEHLFKMTSRIIHAFEKI